MRSWLLYGLSLELVSPEEHRKQQKKHETCMVKTQKIGLWLFINDFVVCPGSATLYMYIYANTYIYI